jgi:BirA family biotin operon repressor/biotin-[acetyl-CoA-carboxylase] ligase
VYDDLDRPPLRAAALRRALAADGWRVEVLERVGSTNAVVSERARAGEPPGLVVVAERQVAGRGRLDRTWRSPARAGLTFSVLLRQRAEVDAQLKWPNDVVVGGRKLCGLLAEAVAPGGLVVGIGLNVTTTRDELPLPSATSLRLEGARVTDRDTLLRAVLRELTAVLADPEGGRDDYRQLCSTLGEQVRIELPAGSVVGTAEAIDDDGRLVVDGAAYGAGDVVHLRPVTP